MERRIKPWINKKIVEYIGEEEQTLVEFICQKVMAHSTPQSILSDVGMVRNITLLCTILLLYMLYVNIFRFYYLVDIILSCREVFLTVLRH